MKIRLRVRTSPTEAFEWEDTAPRFRVGRADDCQLVIRGDAGQLVSGRHVQIELSPDGAVVTDLQSTNGTYVNGERLSGPAAVAAGDQVQLGQAGPRLEVLALDLTAPAPVISISAEAAPSAPEINASPAPSRTQMLLVDMQRQNRRSLAVMAALGLIGVMVVAGVVWNGDRTPTAQQPPIPQQPSLPIKLPTSSIAALPQSSPENFTVSWSGRGTGAAELGTFSVFVSDDGGRFVPFRTDTTDTSATFTGGEPGHTYSFYSVATDTDGNVQRTRKVAQASTVVIALEPPIEPPIEPPGPAPGPEFDVAPFESADFVMVNPTHYAVALEEFEDGRYRVVAIAEAAKASLAINSALAAKVPIIANDRGLSRTIAESVKVGDELPEPLALAVSKYYCHQEFVPETGEFAIFQGLRGGDPGKEPAWRAGFLLGEQEGGITFRELLSPEEEQVRLTDMMPGTLRKGLRERELRESVHVDFLDYALLEICRKLKSPKGQRTHVHLVLEEVKFDVPDKELEDAIDDYWRERRSEIDEAAAGRPIVDVRVGWIANLIGDIRGIIGDRRRDRSKSDAKKRKELLREAHQRLKRLRESLAGEIGAKLSRLDVPILEREELEAIEEERKKAIEDPDEFRKQRDEGEIDPERHNDAGYERMFCASHKLFAQIRWPQHGGEYELDLRLVDVHSGEVRKRVYGDRVTRIPPGGGGPIRPICLPTGGELAVLVFERGGAAVKAARKADVPLHNGLFLQSGRDLKADDVRGAPACLVHILPQPSARTVAFRDLFSAPVCTVPHDAVKETKVHSIDDVPHGEELRYIVWRLARNMLPAAGRVLAVDGPSLKTNLARGDGVTRSDRLLVLRPGADGGPSGEIKACDPIVSQVDDDSCVAVIEGDGAGPVQVGDWVVVRRERSPRVALFLPEEHVEDPLVKRAINHKKKAQQVAIHNATVLHGESVAGRLRAGLARLGVPLSEGELLSRLTAGRVGARQPLNERALDELHRQAGATHAVFASIAPTAASESCPRKLRLMVVDVEHQQVVDSLHVEFSHTRLEALNQWEP